MLQEITPIPKIVAISSSAEREHLDPNGVRTMWTGASRGRLLIARLSDRHAVSYDAG